MIAAITNGRAVIVTVIGADVRPIKYFGSLIMSEEVKVVKPWEAPFEEDPDFADIEAADAEFNPGTLREPDFADEVARQIEDQPCVDRDIERSFILSEN